MEKTTSGQFHRTVLQGYGGQYGLVQLTLQSYLTPIESKVWMELNRRANMTVFEDGSFIVSLEEIGKMVGLKKRRLIDVMESLREIGFIKKYDHARKNRYMLNYSSTKILLGVLNINPTIGWELRNVRGQNHIDFIKNEEVMAACKASEVDFKRCNFLHH